MLRPRLLWTLVPIFLFGSLAGIVAAGASPELPKQSTTSRPVVARSLVQSRAAYLAEVSGDPHPTSVQTFTAANRGQALAELGSGDTVADASPAPVVVVVETGSFTAYGPRPLGSPAATGSVMTLVLNGATGALEDYGLSNAIPNLSALGPITTLSGSPEP